MAEKRRQAMRLYVHSGMLQQDIAELLTVSQKTVSQWKANDEWDKQRAAVTTTKEKELSRWYGMVAAQNDAIEARGQGANFPLPGEADALNKMAAAIQKLEADAGLSATINVFMAFTKWLRKATDLETTKLFAELSNSYIQHLLKA